MTKIQNNKPAYDLEERTFQFAKAVRLFVKTLPKTIATIFINTGKIKIVLVICIWNLRFVWNLMLRVWGFKYSVFYK